MTTEAIEIKVREIIAAELGLAADQITPDKSWAELNADSFDKMDVIMAFEEEFGTEISVDDTEKVQTVRDAIKALEQRGV